MKEFSVDIAGKFSEFHTELTNLAFDIEQAVDALHCLQPDGGFPFDTRAGQDLANSLIAIQYVYADLESHVVPFFDAYFRWTESIQRLYHWLCYTDRTLNTLDTIEAALCTRRKLLARYRCLKARTRPTRFENLADIDELWIVEASKRTNAYMKKGFKDLQVFLTTNKFDQVTMTLTQDSVSLKTN